MPPTHPQVPDFLQEVIQIYCKKLKLFRYHYVSHYVVLSEEHYFMNFDSTKSVSKELVN